MAQNPHKVIFRILQLVVASFTLVALWFMLLGFGSIQFDRGIFGWLIPLLLVFPFLILLRQLFVADRLWSDGSVNLAIKRMMATSLVFVSLASIYIWYVT